MMIVIFICSEPTVNATVDGERIEDQDTTMMDPSVITSDRIPGSNASTLSTASHVSDPESANSSLCLEDMDEENDLIRRVLFSSKENINLLHESFRQVTNLFI